MSAASPAPASAAAASSPAAASPAANEIPPVPAGHAQLYVKNLSFSSTEEGLAAFVEKTVGTKPHSVRIVTRRAGPTATRSRGYGFVTVIEAAKQNGIDKLNNVEFDGRVLVVVEAKPRDPNEPRPQRQPRQPRQPRQNNEAAASSSSSSSSQAQPKPERKSYPDATQLYVNNLSFQTSGEEVSALFESKIGAKPLDVDIVTFKYGRFKGNSRGFGFVWVANNLVEKALALDKTKLNDREIGVQKAKEVTEEEAAASSSSADAGARRRPRRRGPRKDSASGAAPGAAPASTSDDAPDNRRRRGGGDNNNGANAGADGESRGRRRRGGRGGGRGGRGGAADAAAPATAN